LSFILHLNCGPGLYTSRFAKTGAKVTGVDFSHNSLEYDLITMIMCDYTALSPMQRKKLLGIFCRILKPGGSIILDV